MRLAQPFTIAHKDIYRGRYIGTVNIEHGTATISTTLCGTCIDNARIEHACAQGHLASAARHPTQSCYPAGHTDKTRGKVHTLPVSHTLHPRQRKPLQTLLTPPHTHCKAAGPVPAINHTLSAGCKAASSTGATQDSCPASTHPVHKQTHTHAPLPLGQGCLGQCVLTNYARCADASHDMPPAGLSMACCQQAAGTHTYTHSSKICRQASNRTNSQGALGPSSSCTQQQLHTAAAAAAGAAKRYTPGCGMHDPGSREPGRFSFWVVFACMMHGFTAHSPQNETKQRHVLA
jgi:hypothetical protein